MKKSLIFLIILSLVAIISILIIGLQTQDKYIYPIEENQLIFRMADYRMESYPSNIGVREFARLVEERTDGQVRILVYDQNTLGTESSIVEQVAFGGIDFARVSSLFMVEYSPLMKSLLLPNIFEDSEELMKVVNDKEINIILKEDFKKEKINILAWYPGSQRGIFHEKGTLFETKGEKIAVAESQLKIDEISALGFLTVPSKSENVNSYLNANYIEGAEGDLLDYYYNDNYNKANYFTFTPWTIIPEAIIMSNTALKKLTTEQQQIITEIAKEVALYINDLTIEKEAAISIELEELGIQFNEGTNYIDSIISENWEKNKSQEEFKWLSLIEEAKNSR